MIMTIVQAEKKHRGSWVGLRNQLWPGNLAAHAREVDGILSEDSEIAYLLVGEDGVPHGFIEGKCYHSAHHEYGYVEGWFVEPNWRGEGHGQALLDRLEQWFLHHSIERFHSDTDEREYPLSKPAHLRGGYREAYKISVFIKRADDE